MRSVLKSDNFENNVLVKTFEKDFKNKRFKEQIISVDNKHESGFFKVFSLDGARILIRNVELEDFEIQVSHDFPFFKLQFEIEGYSHYRPLNHLSTTVLIPNGHYNLFYLPEVNGILNYKAKRRKTLEIVFTEHYIKQAIGKNFKDIFYRFGEAILNKKPFLMWKESQPITSNLQNHINEIVNCNYPNTLKKPYLEAKLNELLIFLLSKTNEEKQKETHSNLDGTDYNNILKVECFIKNNLKKPLTINQLATHAGINTTKLKQEFRQVYNTSIFKYITTLRMEKAKKLITEEHYTISEASYEVGYKHPQHFTVAFKKTFGLLPSKLNKPVS